MLIKNSFSPQNIDFMYINNRLLELKLHSTDKSSFQGLYESHENKCGKTPET